MTFDLSVTLKDDSAAQRMKAYSIIKRMLLALDEPRIFYKYTLATPETPALISGKIIVKDLRTP